MNPVLHAILWYLRHFRGAYRAEEADYIKTLLKPDDICIDIGAHAGSWTLPLAKAVPDGHVYAFEALPHYARTLAFLLRMMRIQNVTVLEKAAADVTETVQVVWRNKEGKRLTGNTHLATPAESESSNCLSVTSVTLDDWARKLMPSKKVRFVKIDVEGAELSVLRGATKFIADSRPILFMEVVTSCCARYDYLPSDLFAFIRSLDYRIFVIKTSGTKFVLEPTDCDRYSGKGDILALSEREGELP